MAHGDSPYDYHEILEEEGTCPYCFDKKPCGCETEDEEELELLNLNDPID